MHLLIGLEEVQLSEFQRCSRRLRSGSFSELQAQLGEGEVLCVLHQDDGVPSSLELHFLFDEETMEYEATHADGWSTQRVGYFAIHQDKIRHQRIAVELQYVLAHSIDRGPRRGF